MSDKPLPLDRLRDPGQEPAVPSYKQLLDELRIWQATAHLRALAKELKESDLNRDPEEMIPPLLEFLDSLDETELEEFEERVGDHLGSLYPWACGDMELPLDIARRIEEATEGKLALEVLRPESYCKFWAQWKLQESKRQEDGD